MKNELLLNPLSILISVTLASFAFSSLADTDPVTQSIDSAAEEGGSQIERIAITGSNIKRVHNEDATPVEVVSADDIERSGKVTLTDVLRELTVNTGNSYDEQATTSFTAGSASVGLRGLSSKNTLILVNGQRVSNYGFAQGTQDTFIDLNALPVSSVERIEVLKDGASSVYGSDAITGVINIILKNNYEGTELHAGLGKATEGGLQHYSGGFVTGFGNTNTDGYNFVFSLDALNRAGLNADQRKLTRTGDYRHLPGGKLNAWSTQGGNFLDESGLPTAFDVCPAGSEKIDLSELNPSRNGPVCAFNTQQYSTLQPELKRRQFSAQGNFQLSSRFNAHVEFLYSHNNSSHIFGSPLSVGSGLRAYDQETGTLVDIPVKLPVGHPNNPTNEPLAFEYTFFDIGTRLKENSQIFNRVLGKINYEGDSWDWTLTALQSKSRQREYVQNFVNRYAFENLLASGEYDFFNGNNSQEAIDALRINTLRPGSYDLSSINFSATSILAYLPYGDLAIATGVDWREESMNADTSEEVLSGTELRPAINLVKGSRNVIAAYIEADLPLYEGLILNGAVRADDYSDFGHAVSPKLALHYVLADDWLLRASWSKGFRAPSLPENAQSNTISYSSAIDPKDPIAPGTQKGFTSVRSGNPDLKPERSNNFNGGLVWSPNRGLNASFDYYKIELNNIIGSDNTNHLLENEAIYSDRIQRDEYGFLQIITNKYHNQGTKTVAGYDIEIGYKTEIGQVDVGLASNWSRLVKYEQAQVAGTAAVNGAGTNLFGALPKWKSNTQLQLNTTHWNYTLNAKYIGKFEQRRVTETTNPGFKPFVDSFISLDTQIAYKGIKNSLISISVRNLLDTNPPFNPASGASYFDITQYDNRGRTVDVRYRYFF